MSAFFCFTSYISRLKYKIQNKLVSSLDYQTLEHKIRNDKQFSREEICN